ncbi:MAG: DUF2637 domain-containing protein [Streptosporangiales bacterium]|nr:DUF2637 domain-containing protein [Streptosporangiales bacterium]
MGITTERARAVTRWSAVTIMAVAVVTATADGFAQSYAGLYEWALNHGLSGWKASSFPLMVDLLIVVGELGLFLLAIDAYSLQHRRQFLTWFDFLLPLMIAIAGWTTSVIFNVGHVREQEFSYQATAAVPPIVSMLGLLVLLRTLHRYVSDRPTGRREEPASAMQEEPSGPAGVIHPTAELAVAAAAATAAPAVAGGPAAGPPAEEPVAEPVAEEPVTQRAVRLVQLAPSFMRPAEPHIDGDGQSDGRGGTDGVDGTGGVLGGAGGAPSNGQDGGHGDVQGNGGRSHSPVALNQASRDHLLEELHKHGGNVTAVLASMAEDGLTYDEEEAHRVRTNVWLPYVVYRLLAQHEGDVNRVSQALQEKQIDCESSLLNDLASSWQ